MIDALKDKRIGVLNGGFSEERDVSLRSGFNIHAALIKKGYDAIRLDPAIDNILASGIDIAYNTLHGPYGEDGSIQSLLDHYKIPYTGSGPQASMLGMNKWLTKTILEREKMPTAAYQMVTAHTQSVPLTLTFPVIIKPGSLGSSVGIILCETETEYKAAIKDQVHQFECCLVEEWIQGQEITIGVLDRASGPQALPILELQSHNQFYDYEAKYTPNKTTFILPARLNPTMTQTCQSLAVQLHQLLGCRGSSRTDMIVHSKRGPMILEINTLPGMTDLSDLPAQAKQAGIEFEDLVEIILESALCPHG